MLAPFQKQPLTRFVVDFVANPVSIQHAASGIPRSDSIGVQRLI